MALVLRALAKSGWISAIAVVATAAATVSAVAATTPPPTLKIGVPGTVHVNKTYRVKASGHTAERLNLSVWVQTEADGKCKKTFEQESTTNAYPAIQTKDGAPLVQVGPGKYKKRSSKLADTQANGHDYVCGYLNKDTNRGLKTVLRVQKKIKSVP